MNFSSNQSVQNSESAGSVWWFSITQAYNVQNNVKCQKFSSPILKWGCICLQRRKTVKVTQVVRPINLSSTPAALFACNCQRPLISFSFQFERNTFQSTKRNHFIFWIQPHVFIPRNENRNSTIIITCHHFLRWKESTRGFPEATSPAPSSPRQSCCSPLIAPWFQRHQT